MATKQKNAKHSSDGAAASQPTTTKWKRAIQAEIADQPAFFYPPGRHAWRDIYTEDKIQKIGRDLKIAGVKLDRLHFELCRLAEKWIILIAENAIEFPYRERIQYLDRNVIQPARTLLKSVEYDNHPMLWYWLHPRMKSPRPNLLALERDLTRLSSWATEFKQNLTDIRCGNPKDRTNLRHDIVWDITILYASTFPSRRPKRISHKGKRGIENEFAAFVRTVAEPILQSTERLDHQIQVAVKKYNEMKKPPQI